MEHRRLGTSDVAVSAVGLGGNTFGPPRLDEKRASRVISAALDAGVDFIDTANVYGQGESEVYIGNAIHDRRDDVVLGTKFNLMGRGDAKLGEWITARADESLGKLRTDRIDLLQLHMPDPQVPTEELLEALDALVRAGKVRAIGCSNYSGWRLAESTLLAESLGTAAFVSVQNHYSLLHRHPEQELTSACERYSVSLIPYHPLGGGFLTGKYRPGEPPPPGSRGAAGSPIVERMSTERNWAIVEALETFAKERDHTVGELAIAWLLANEVVASVIAGASDTDQVAVNVGAAAWTLSAEEKATVDEIAATSDGEPAEAFARGMPRSPSAR
jgi:aryl-alcohol dehydrogenase-like predicted oxidoreductase